MTATPKIHMKSTEDVHILTIEGVNEKHTGEYKCVATNKAGEAEHSAVVTVKGKKAPQQTRDVDSMPNIKTTLCQRLVFSRIVSRMAYRIPSFQNPITCCT